MNKKRTGGGGGRTLYGGDCLDVLKDELALPTGSVDLIYLDPPFNSKSNYNLPFKNKGKHKDVKPVEAFKDTWTWGDKEEKILESLSSGPSTKYLADIIRLSQKLNQMQRKISTSAYLANMAIRLIPMKRVLKDTGSIYLHCDPTASYYLRLLLDAIFGQENFRNEIIWSYKTGGTSKKWFGRKHDVILFYTNGSKYTFNLQKEKAYTKSSSRKAGIINYGAGSAEFFEDAFGVYNKVNMRDVWEISYINSQSRERTGYPTQKPKALLSRIIKSSSNVGDVILDPFCGCGTTVHVAERLGRKWIGIDISTFSVGLIKTRILNNFPKLNAADIRSIGSPTDIASARKLAKEPFEFEKWVCGQIGAHGMYKNPGAKGRDGGVDGVIEFALFKGLGKKPKKEFAIVQIKAGKVTPDSVRALSHTVEQFDATAGIFVCFNEYMSTVENNRKKHTYEDLTGVYPIIQGFSVEQLLGGERPKLPPVQFDKKWRKPQSDFFQ